jgi:hypothetical protein
MAIKGQGEVLEYPLGLGEQQIPGWIEFQIKKRNMTQIGATAATIGLYMPENIAMPSTTSWENETHSKVTEVVLAGFRNMNPSEATTLYQGLQGMQSEEIYNAVNDKLKQTGKSLSEMGIGALAAQEGIRRANNFLSDAEGNGLGNGGLGGVFGLAPNPFLTAIFRGVDFRTFEFQFKFYPHNKNEAERVRKIVQLFRQAALPSYGRGTAGLGVFDYPNVLNITYKWGKDDNYYMHKFKPCVMTAIDVNYTGLGGFYAFEDGDSVCTVLNMRFSETEIVVKDDVQKGY